MAVPWGHVLVRSLALPFGVKLHGVDGVPLSGPSGTKAGGGGAGTTVFDRGTGLVFVNEGSSASPYWSPISTTQARLQAFATDFRDGVGRPHATTSDSSLLASGVRVHGDGVEETDSGLVVTWTAERGPVGRITVTDEDGHLVALSLGGDNLPFQPDIHGPLVVECEFASVSSSLARAVFLGFAGSTTAALTPRVTGNGTWITLVDADLAGLLQDARLNDATGVFFAETKGGAGTQNVNGQVTGETMAAVGTYQTWRVEVARDGTIAGFINREQVFRQVGGSATGLDVDEELMPFFTLESTSSAVKSVDVARFAAWGQRP